MDGLAGGVKRVFVITWLTVVCIKLKEIKTGKRPRTRSRGKEPSKPQRLAP
jgi:hypothetical protein